jgi:hypothetical protein
MASFAQTPVVISPGGFGVTHTYSFACSPSNTMVLLLPDTAGDITGITLTGASGTFPAADYSSGLERAFSLSNLPSGVTGFSYTTAAAHSDETVVAFEAVGTVVFDAAGSMPGDFTDVVSAAVTTTAADDLLVARWGAATGVFTPDAGYAATGITNATLAEYNSSALGAAATETIGGAFDNSVGGRGGYAVAYRESGGGGGPTTYNLSSDIYL